MGLTEFPFFVCGFLSISPWHRPTTLLAFDVFDRQSFVFSISAQAARRWAEGEQARTSAPRFIVVFTGIGEWDHNSQ